MPYSHALPAETPPAEEKRWTLNHRASGCPAGRRNADAHECLHAIEEAVVGIYVIAGFKVLREAANAEEGAWSLSIPSGCSYSNVTQRAIFKHSHSGSSFQNVKDNYRHVCSNDEHATTGTDSTFTPPSLLPSPSPSPSPSPGLVGSRSWMWGNPSAPPPPSNPPPSPPPPSPPPSPPPRPPCAPPLPPPRSPPPPSAPPPPPPSPWSPYDTEIREPPSIDSPPLPKHVLAESQASG